MPHLTIELWTSSKQLQVSKTEVQVGQGKDFKLLSSAHKTSPFMPAIKIHIHFRVRLAEHAIFYLTAKFTMICPYLS